MKLLNERTEGEKLAYFEGYKQSFEQFKYLILKHQRNIAFDKMETTIKLLSTVLYKED